MLTNQQLRERAEQMAFEEYFCNVDQMDWPDDPLGMLSNDMLFSDDGEYCLLVWEPFEDYTTRDLFAMINSAIDSYEEHLKWARDSAA